MTQTLEYRTIDKSTWGEGPWRDEPDKRQWSDPETGLPCLIVRGPSGALCGYVGVSPGHPAHGLSYSHWDYDDESPPLAPIKAAINALGAHGGLTYADGCQHGSDPARGVCHIPAPGDPDDVWWFGFDCAHAGDYSPAYDRRNCPVLGLGSPTGWGGVIEYRDFAYVTSDVEALAGQLDAMAQADPISPPPPAGGVK